MGMAKLPTGWGLKALGLALALGLAGLPAPARAGLMLPAGVTTAADPLMAAAGAIRVGLTSGGGLVRSALGLGATTASSRAMVVIVSGAPLVAAVGRSWMELSSSQARDATRAVSLDGSRGVDMFALLVPERAAIPTQVRARPVDHLQAHLLRERKRRS